MSDRSGDSGYSMVTRASPKFTVAPRFTWTAVTAPSTGATISLAIFIASRTTTTSPVLTVWPAETRTSKIRPGNGAVTTSPRPAAGFATGAGPALGACAAVDGAGAGRGPAGGGATALAGAGGGVTLGPGAGAHAAVAAKGSPPESSSTSTSNVSPLTVTLNLRKASYPFLLDSISRERMTSIRPARDQTEPEAAPPSSTRRTETIS